MHFSLKESKVVSVHLMNTYRGSRGIAPLIRNPGTRPSCPSHFPYRKECLATEQEFGCVQGPVWTVWREGASIVCAGMRALNRQHSTQSLQPVRRCSQIHGENIERHVAVLFTAMAAGYRLQATICMNGSVK